MAAHEVGHTVKTFHALDNESKQNAFTIRYTGGAAAANLSAPGTRLWGYTVPLGLNVVVTGGADDFSLDPRTAAFDTMQEVVNDINGRANYTAALSAPPNKPNRHPFTIVTHAAGGGDVTNQDIKTAAYQVKSYNDEYLMTPRWGPGSLNLQFNRVWARSVKAMDVAHHHGM